MDWEVLRDVIIRQILFPSSCPRPARASHQIASTPAPTPELDLDSIDYLLSELRSNAVTIDAERDDQLTLDEVERHHFALVAGPLLPDLFGVPVPDVAWWCSDVLDGYIADTRVLLDDDTAAVEAGAGRPKPKPSSCELCQRPMPLTAHHLYPRSEHTRLLKRTELTKYELHHTIAWLCRPCHSAVHGMIDAGTLAREYASVDALRGHEGVGKWVKWAERQRVTGRGLRTAR